MNWLQILVLTAAMATAASSQPRATLAGQVLDSSGRPLASAMIEVLDHSELAALTDSAGEFMLRDVPVGDVTIRASSLGYVPLLHYVQLASHDSAYVTLRLLETRIPFPGEGVPLPGLSLLQAAKSLLPRVLKDSAVLRLASSQLAMRDTVVVWVPWATDDVQNDFSNLHLRSACTACLTSISYTVEGGQQYKAGQSHLRIGVAEDGSSDRIAFCIDPADAGDVLMSNCFGSGRTVLIRYSLVNGEWLPERPR